MSFFCYLTVAQCCLLAADNKKHVLTRRADRQGFVRTEHVTVSNARKIHALGAGWWMTGVGLGEFLARVQDRVRNLLNGAGDGEEPSTVILTHLQPHWLKAQYDDVVNLLTCGLPSGKEDLGVFERRQEMLFAGFDGASRPVVLRAGSAEEFFFRCWAGPGSLGFSGDDGTYSPEVTQEIQRFLYGVLTELSQGPVSEIGRRAWDLMPPLFRWMARGFPENLSANGDLVCITPTSNQWFLF